MISIKKEYSSVGQYLEIAINEFDRSILANSVLVTVKLSNPVYAWMIGVMFTAMTVIELFATNIEEERRNQERIEQIKRGAVMIKTDKPGNVEDVGAGIFIGKSRDQSFFLTTYHVVITQTNKRIPR